MINIYTDASFDLATGLGVYCVVIDTGDGEQPTWYTEIADDGLSPSHAEHEGIIAALNSAKRFKRKVTIYCDNMSAIKACTAQATREGVRLLHIKGHQLGKDDISVSDHVKRHHWADTVARNELNERLKKTKEN